MPKLVLLDEFHLSLFVPDDLSAERIQAARDAVDAADFRAGLRRVVVAFLATRPDLADVRVRVGR
jgi:hypothetical protein